MILPVDLSVSRSSKTLKATDSGHSLSIKTTIESDLSLPVNILFWFVVSWAQAEALPFHKCAPSSTKVPLPARPRPRTRLTSGTLSCQSCSRVVDQGTASLLGAAFSGGCCVPSVLPRNLFHVDRYCRSWVVRSATEPPNFLCGQFCLSCDLNWWSFIIGVFSISHVSCAFSFYHRPLMVVLAKNTSHATERP